jgi:hypothetical protein
MFKSLDIQKDMEVVGLEGNHVNRRPLGGRRPHHIEQGRSESRRAAASHLDRLGRLCGPEGPSQKVVGKRNFAMAGGCLNKPHL